MTEIETPELECEWLAAELDAERERSSRLVEALVDWFHGQHIDDGHDFWAAIAAYEADK